MESQFFPPWSDSPTLARNSFQTASLSEGVKLDL